MQYSDVPNKQTLPFANDVSARNSIPTNPGTPGQANLTEGFPPLTRVPVASGGVPPAGLDMNGILHDLNATTRWASVGGGYKFDGTYAIDPNVNGYPAGAVVLMDDGLGYWLNTVDNNTTSPTNAGAAAAGWVPYQSNGISVISLGGVNVTLTPNQYGKMLVKFTGAMSANVNVIFPAIAGVWTVINATTGSYAVMCKTASGTGVRIPKNQTRTIYCDGTNVSFDDHVTDTFDIRDYGAPCNGIDDDYPAIIAACAALTANGGGALVFPQNGTIFINHYIQNGPSANGILRASFTSLSGVRIRGNGSTITCLGGWTAAADYSSGGFTFSYKVNWGFEFNNCTDIAAFDLTLNGGAQTITKVATGESYSHGMAINGCKRIFMQNVAMTYTICDGFIYGGYGPNSAYVACEQAVMINCVGYRNARQGVSVIQLRGWTFISCRFDEQGKSAFGSYSPAAGCDVEPNLYPGMGGGVNGDQFTGDGLFIDCQFKDNVGDPYVSSNINSVPYPITHMRSRFINTTAGGAYINPGTSMTMLDGCELQEVDILPTYGSDAKAFVYATNCNITSSNPASRPIFLAYANPVVVIEKCRIYLLATTAHTTSYRIWFNGNAQCRFNDNYVYIAATEHDGAGWDYFALIQNAVARNNTWDTNLSTAGLNFAVNYSSATVDNDYFVNPTYINWQTSAQTERYYSQGSYKVDTLLAGNAVDDSVNKLNVLGKSKLTGVVSVVQDSSTTSEGASGIVLGNGTTKLLFGANATNSINYLQGVNPGVAYTRPLSLQPLGGNTLIGTQTDNTVNKLQVSGSISAYISAGTTIGKNSDASSILNQAGAVGSLSQINFGYSAIGTTTYSPAAIGFITTNGGGSTKGDLIFATRNGTTDAVPTEVARITSGQNFLIGTSTDNGADKLQVNGAIKSIAGTSGIGYATGAGGAVTQTSSRVTGVTLDKVCGKITLVSAAGSSSWQTFTVSNSAVAAGDVVNIVQASGSNLYSVLVTSVSAGAFNVSVSAVSGTATESPVLNFAVIKAVSA